MFLWWCPVWFICSDLQSLQDTSWWGGEAMPSSAHCLFGFPHPMLPLHALQSYTIHQGQITWSWAGGERLTALPPHCRGACDVILAELIHRKCAFSSCLIALFSTWHRIPCVALHCITLFQGAFTRLLLEDMILYSSLCCWNSDKRGKARADLHCKPVWPLMVEVQRWNEERFFTTLYQMWGCATWKPGRNSSAFHDLTFPSWCWFEECKDKVRASPQKNGTQAEALLRWALGRATAPTEPYWGCADSWFTWTTFTRTLSPT